MLLKRETGLAHLQLELMSVKDEGGDSFCANRMWYVRYEPQLKTLVGKQAARNDPFLRSQEAYDLSYHHLYKLLPNCRNCVCVPW